jgi:hypothetical protein
MVSLTKASLGQGTPLRYWFNQFSRVHIEAPQASMSHSGHNGLSGFNLQPHGL